MEKELFFTEEEMDIFSRLTSELREKLETYKKRPTEQKFLAIYAVHSEVYAFLIQLQALRGIKSPPYKVS